MAGEMSWQALLPRVRVACGRSHGRRHAACMGAAFAATVLPLVLLLSSGDLRAELVFRSAQQPVDATDLPPLRNFAHPADVAYPRELADGSTVAAEEVQVFVRGYITPEDVYAAKVLETLVRRGSHRIAGNAVSVAGNGGDIDAAMEVGRVLRRLGVSTVVAPGEQCLSSCVFAFMGGDRRTAAGRLGIHRPYFASNRKVPDRRAYYRQLQKRLREYIDELDFPPSLYEAVMAVPPESISVLGAAELKRFYLQGMSPSAEDEADAAAANAQGISVLEYLQTKAQALPCAGVAERDSACAGVTRQAVARDAVIPEAGSADRSGAMPAVGRVAGQGDEGSAGTVERRGPDGASRGSR